MADQKKDKPKVEVRDLKPNKDAKGGSKTLLSSGKTLQSGSKSVQSSGKSVQ